MMLLMLSLLLSMIFMFLNHPMSMGLILLMQTIIVSLITGMMNSNFWFSYILFLIMIGGMLVIFIYMTSIASNEMFNYSNSILYLSLTTINAMMLIMLIQDNYFINYFFNYNKYLFTLNTSLMKFFNYPSIFIMIMMIIYLFITLIAIVKITKIEYGPLRPKN
uniref:NADH-ubiquinone oxidoreductase chain 6 n=1 Tax=Staphylinidae sp. BMNH 1274257 TaxID=1796576 RepID=A0A126TEZ7_9COLE|nr:NADH dehydrogenase subunit 6 [Staphylinidae sp. BMNH 1274257]